MMLLEVAHFMNQSGQGIGQRTGAEMVRVQGDFIGNRVAARIAPGAAPEIAVGFPVTLHGQQAGGQRAAEQFPVEIPIGPVEFRIGFFGGFHIGADFL